MFEHTQQTTITVLANAQYHVMALDQIGFLGYSANELIGHSILKLATGPKANKPQFAVSISEAFKTKATKRQFICYDKFGASHQFLVVFEPLVRDRLFE